MDKSQTLSSPDSNKILSIQMLRGLAALLVVYMHAIIHQTQLNIGNSVQQQFYFWATFGAVGVDIFFVISGFIITVISAKFLREHGVKDFFIKRLIRIVPIYWLLSLLEITNSFIQHPERLNAQEIIKTITILPIFDQNSFVFPVIGLGWTLAFEVYFYLVVGLFLATRRQAFILYAALFMLTLIGLGVVAPEIRVPMFEFMANPMILEFLLGCLIGWLYQSKAKPGIGLSLSLVILAILGLSMTIGLDTDTISRAEHVLNHTHVAVFRLLVWGIPSALLVAGLVFLESNHRLQANRSLILFGDASYSIYLTHFFVLTAFDKLWLRLGLQLPDLFILIAVLVSIAIGTVFYILIEKNLLTYLNAKYKFYCQRRVHKVQVPLSVSRKN